METGQDWILGSAPVVMWGAIIVFNIAILRLLQMTLKNVDLQGALMEKGPADTIKQVTTSAEPTPTDGGGIKMEQKETKETSQGISADTSYSRVAGMVGAVVLACFIWGIGNIVLYKAFADPGGVESLLASLGGFFLAGASLFAPYAFNQLSSAFKGS
ncbi:MAG: hypothetical protein JWQ89_2762 [Devosia sp.]|uniref:hypothetical protein n=1 Tax=Devosia sp. TaxID=1871048 RepID=UPI00260BE5E6|nr:hypothetical protein [Devosia sp.]MDB5541035.1 hypothetical protein [Devosia sp.]